MAPITFHLRSEDKKLEHRSALTPNTVRELLENGFAVNVERSPVRIFRDIEFEEAGATLVQTGSWPDAPVDNIIIGLKELIEEDFPLVHTHIQFAHCYKGQGGWEEVLSRFPRGGGTLYDMEFLEDENGRRVAAFGYHAGYAGMALAIMDWAWQLFSGGKTPMPGKQYYKNVGDLIEEVKADLEKGLAKTSGRIPQILVIGALGRCGGGALDLCRAVGIPESNLLKWDMAETAKGGPFIEIRESDIFVNCIYLSADIPKFVTEDFLKQGPRQLSVVADVSCDTSNPLNPIPFCNKPTYFDKPTITLPESEFCNPPLSYITIDHLPSLLPREASESFSAALLPSLLELKNRSNSRVWQKAGQLFHDKVATLPPQLQQAKGIPNGNVVPAVGP
ncbi:Saccharopine dehydrogenase [Imshaugia aleurites]|uniref:Saccharopine dehydrogenase [NAD(+), L-lysine-forming] n=1 Tax=Imshaugia aleurites TaxID=172621 RepID=A0A8H3G7S1_9LECA|nr:Saccharopine dehydrogenase [Imshaugia aleurites]